jgi:hypothetical protein
VLKIKTPHFILTCGVGKSTKEIIPYMMHQYQNPIELFDGL